MIYLGIDPGASGGVAALLDVGGGIEIETTKMPDQPGDLVDLLRSYTSKPDEKWIGFPRSVGCVAVCERVGPNRGKGERRQGASSMFTFGRGFGRIETALIAAGISHEFYTPQVWQAAFGLKRTDKAESDTAKKNRHKAAAVRLFPGRKIVHWEADAILLAEFCRRTQKARYGQQSA